MNKLVILAGTAVLAAVATVGNVLALGGNGNGMGAAAPVVAPDGTVLVFQPAVEPEAAAASGIELVAITPAGTVAWRQSLGTGVHDLALAGDLVVLTRTESNGAEESAGAATGIVTALQLASGVEVWSTELEGIALAMAAAGDRIYVRVVEPAATATSQGGTCDGTGGNGGKGGNGGNGGGTQGGGGGGQQGGKGGDGANGAMNNGAGWNGTFSLVALGLDGQILWSIALAE